MKFDLLIISYGSVGTNTLKFRQSKCNNSSISETIVTSFDVHHHINARYIITVSFMKFHPLVTMALKGQIHCC